MGNTLLIVEDHHIFRRMLKGLIQDWFPSLDIVEATDFPEALRLAAAHAPEVILMDIHLPCGNGLHATRLIKEDLPGTIVIVLTSENSPQYRKAAFENEASHFISKYELASSNLRSFLGEAFDSPREISSTKRVLPIRLRDERLEY